MNVESNLRKSQVIFKSSNKRNYLIYISNIKKNNTLTLVSIQK